MASIITKKEERTPIVRTFYLGACKPVDPSSIPTVTGRVTTVKNPVSKRAKPVSLIDDLTSLATQVTQTELAAVIVTKSPYQGTTWCPGNKTTGKYDTYSRTVVWPYLPGWDDSDLPNWALALRLKMQDDKVSFAESIGEWKETAKLAVDGVGILTRAVKETIKLFKTRAGRRNYRKWFNRTFGRSPDSKLELMDAVSVDLAIKFGIVPNVRLIEDSLQMLDLVKASKRRLQVSVSRDKDYSVSDTLGNVCSGTRTLSVRAIAYVTYDVDSSNFTAGNMAESIWAGIPFSFMVDWFWNVGSYLTSFNAMNGVKTIKGVVCIKTQITMVDRRTYSASGYIERLGSGRSKTYERRAFSGLPSLPYAALPTPELPEFDLGKLWSAIEVLLSLRRSSG